MFRGTISHFGRLTLLLATVAAVARGQELAPLPLPLEDCYDLAPIPQELPLPEEMQVGPGPYEHRRELPLVREEIPLPEITEEDYAPLDDYDKLPPLVEEMPPPAVTQQDSRVGTTRSRPAPDDRRGISDNRQRQPHFDATIIPGVQQPYLSPHPSWSWKHWWCSRPNMVQRNAYYPESHGYYYMHPYNVAHLRAHQEFAESWGGNSLNPYSNEIFEDLESAAGLDSEDALEGADNLDAEGSLEEDAPSDSEPPPETCIRPPLRLLPATGASPARY